ncbi:hypothetical protein AB7942_10405 [Neobacillus sp. BF23-41]|uniref:hypothetical protein n=1 Tax=Neobacillus sp. BF23-41 TaxID=3240280 RepID=UPI0034E3AE56
MYSNLVTNVRTALAYTVQAIRYADSALILFLEMSAFPLPPNPIKIQFYQDVVDNLTEAYLAMKALPFDTYFPSDPVFPNAPIAPQSQDNQHLIQLSDNRISLALDKTEDTINYLDQAILLSGKNDRLNGQLFFIKLSLEAARDALVSGLNEPDFDNH